MVGSCNRSLEPKNYTLRPWPFGVLFLTEVGLDATTSARPEQDNEISSKCPELDRLLEDLGHEFKVLIRSFSKFDTKGCKQQRNNLQVAGGARYRIILIHDEPNSLRNFCVCCFA